MSVTLKVTFAGECKHLGATLRLYTINDFIYIGAFEYSSINHSVPTHAAICDDQKLSVVELSAVIPHEAKCFETMIYSHICKHICEYLGSGEWYGHTKVFTSPSGDIFIANHQSTVRIGFYDDGVFGSILTTPLSDVYSNMLKTEVMLFVERHKRIGKAINDKPDVDQVTPAIKQIETLKFVTKIDTNPTIMIFADEDRKLYVEYAAAMAMLQMLGYKELVPIEAMCTCLCARTAIVISLDTFNEILREQPGFALQNNIDKLIMKALIADKLSIPEPDISDELHEMVNSWIERYVGEQSVHAFLQDCANMIEVFDKETGFKIKMC